MLSQTNDTREYRNASRRTDRLVSAKTLLARKKDAQRTMRGEAWHTGNITLCLLSYRTRCTTDMAGWWEGSAMQGSPTSWI